MAQKLSELTESIEQGGIYSIPCFQVFLQKEYEEEWNDDRYLQPRYDQVFLFPVYDHPHSDKENGQQEIHYHIDYRFDIPQHANHIKYKLGTKYMISRIKQFSNIIDLFSISFQVSDKKYMWSDNLLHYHDLVCVQPFGTGTPVSFISNSKLKHKCIHKGKCPHRGYDLTHVPEIDGVITCPLHNLRFDSQTKELLNDPYQR